MAMNVMERRQRDRAYYHKTRQRRRELQRQRYKNNPESFAITNKRGVLKRKYGLSLAEYEQMFQVQNGLCAICSQPETARLLSVDHNHETQVVRALLCGNCNRALGLFKDSHAIVEKAADYLATHGGSH